MSNKDEKIKVNNIINDNNKNIKEIKENKIKDENNDSKKELKTLCYDCGLTWGEAEEQGYVYG